MRSHIGGNIVPRPCSIHVLSSARTSMSARAASLAPLHAVNLAVRRGVIIPRSRLCQRGSGQSQPLAIPTGVLALELSHRATAFRFRRLMASLAIGPQDWTDFAVTGLWPASRLGNRQNATAKNKGRKSFTPLGDMASAFWRIANSRHVRIRLVYPPVYSRFYAGAAGAAGPRAIPSSQRPPMSER